MDQFGFVGFFVGFDRTVIVVTVLTTLPCAPVAALPSFGSYKISGIFPKHILLEFRAQHTFDRPCIPFLTFPSSWLYHFTSILGLYLSLGVC